MLYSVYYMKPDFFRDGIHGKLPTIAKLTDTHTYLRDVHATSLDDVYTVQQAHNWGHNYRASNAMLGSLGLQHTSMSVGDVIVYHDGTGPVFYVVAGAGFKRLER
jgi:hypothetical protein